MSQIGRSRSMHQLLCYHSVLSNAIIIDNILYYKDIINIKAFLPINSYIQWVRKTRNIRVISYFYQDMTRATGPGSGHLSMIIDWVF